MEVPAWVVDPRCMTHADLTRPKPLDRHGSLDLLYI